MSIARRLAPLLRAAAGLGALTAVSSVLVNPDIPPKGFNSFDSYGGLNHSSAVRLAEALKQQLLPAGYDTICLDGGWSVVGAGKNRTQTLDASVFFCGGSSPGKSLVRLNGKIPAFAGLLQSWSESLLVKLWLLLEVEISDELEPELMITFWVQMVCF